MKPGISSSVVGDATKSKESWTTEPWTAVVDEPMERGGTRTFVSAPSKRFVLVGDEADVRRACACVNACAGLNPAGYQEVIRCLENLIRLIKNGYDAPETVDMDSWDAACQAYRDSLSFQDAKEILLSLNE